MNRFTDNKDGTVTDNETGLMWTKNANMDGQKNWEDAIDWCNELDYAGYRDWRLPSIHEWISFINFTRAYPALPEGHPFTDVQSYAYWSATTDAVDTDYAWFVGMGSSHVSNVKKSNPYHVWAVRSNNIPKKGEKDEQIPLQNM